MSAHLAASAHASRVRVIEAMVTSPAYRRPDRHARRPGPATRDGLSLRQPGPPRADGWRAPAPRASGESWGLRTTRPDESAYRHHRRPSARRAARVSVRRHRQLRDGFWHGASPTRSSPATAWWCCSKPVDASLPGTTPVVGGLRRQNVTPVDALITTGVRPRWPSRFRSSRTP
jgi:hypothetical protein